MTDHQHDAPIWNAELGGRIKSIIKLLGGTACAARIVNKSPMQMMRYGKGHEPPASVLIGLARAAKVSLDWLATGQAIELNTGTPPRREGLGEADPPTFLYNRHGVCPPPKDEVQFVPHYAAQLHAGDGEWIDRARLICYLPFSRRLLLRYLGGDTRTGLAVLGAVDNAMAPTIQADDLILIDGDVTNLSDGVFAFIQGNSCRIKRFRFRLDGTVDVLNDNTQLYPMPHHPDRLDVSAVHFIGRVRWVGRWLA